MQSWILHFHHSSLQCHDLIVIIFLNITMLLYFIKLMHTKHDTFFDR